MKENEQSQEAIGREPWQYVRGTEPSYCSPVEEQYQRMDKPLPLHRDKLTKIGVEGQKKFRTGGNNRKKKRK